MRILLYNPDNGVTQNFMPHLWMFLLQALTPNGHEVILIDGNTQPMSDPELVQFALDQQIGVSASDYSLPVTQRLGRTVGYATRGFVAWIRSRIRGVTKAVPAPRPGSSAGPRRVRRHAYPPQRRLGA